MMVIVKQTLAMGSYLGRKAASLWTFSKRGDGGVQPESKSFEVVCSLVFGLSFGPLLGGMSEHI